MEIDWTAYRIVRFAPDPIKSNLPPGRPAFDFSTSLLHGFNTIPCIFAAASCFIRMARGSRLGPAAELRARSAPEPAGLSSHRSRRPRQAQLVPYLPP